MSEITDLVVIEKSTAIDVFKSSDNVNGIIDKVEREVEAFVADVKTAKGRKEIASMAYKVAQSKTYLDGLGKDLVAELKEVPKLIDANRKTVRDRLDALRDKVRLPLTEWEAEQERIKAEEEAKRAAEELAKKVEADHEIALLLNDKFDRDLAEAKAEAERKRIAHEEELKRQAAERAKQEAEAKARAEIEAAARREAEAKAAAERAERERIEAQQRAEREAKEAAERAEREKQAAIEAERRKAQEEADRVKRESEEKEAARMAEEKRIAYEQAKREADVRHRKAVGTDIVNALTTKTGISREDAIRVLTALKDGFIPHTRITY